MSLSQLYQSSGATASVDLTAADPVASFAPESRSLWRRLLRLPAWLLPFTLIAAFGAVFAVVYRDQLLPAPVVQVSRAVLLADLDAAPTAASAHASDHSSAAPIPAAIPPPPAASAGKMLFQAGGWVEPDPLPIHAVALTDGVIEKVNVLEGQEVKKGQVIAELIAEDIRLALKAAERTLAEAEAAVTLQTVQVEVADAEARAMQDQVTVAEARLAEEKDNLARLERIPTGSVSEQDRARARFVVQGQVAEVAARQSQHRASVAKVQAARAQIQVLAAAVASARVMVEKQQLALTRTQIVSPVDGVILALKAAPGQKKVMNMDEHDSSVVATLFEKGHLQVRVDVPLSEARGLTVGQPAIITSDFLPQVEFNGVVTRIVGAADLQRNTLQAKVQVQSPDARLRPEMLCRVKFLEPASGAAINAEASSKSGSVPAQATPEADRGDRVVMVPESAVISAAGEKGEDSLWLVAPDGHTAIHRKVQLGTPRIQDHVAIASGVLAGDLVILPPHVGLADGRRVRPEKVTP
ncbi:efflux RND transporter periplasmic adaptor subunit [Verrucomicrobium sp. BvORR106]|uniref:efflux RND transporter periplasmic adaptor subunit n=1 Tax=Verrucomicrobium sp. BvORR106 TaxID=1403819 RepID=UPI002240EE57|nr:efflux RND transporter periplasmic adaptor subunit [Verrucomicrobium sp. BvORR106]